jgi:hypothetical protein
MTKLSTITVVDSIESYDEVLERACVEGMDICGIPRNARFETLSSEQLQKLSRWYVDNGEIVRLCVKDVAFALHIKGAVEVDPAKDSWNYSRGTGKDRTYYWCSRNIHNRPVKGTNKGTLTKEGLKHDLANGLFVNGPVAHIDAYTVISSLQHRDDSAIDVFDETGVFPEFEVFTFIGLPPQLNAAIDRGAAKDSKDQEFIDTTQFTESDLESWLEYMPAPQDRDIVKLRKELTSMLVTVRTNVFSRLNGTGYHPNGVQKPSKRQELALSGYFDGGPKALERLIVECYEASHDESGKKAPWAKAVPPSMLPTIIVLASNRDNVDPTDIQIDSDVCSAVLKGFGLVSDEGMEGYSPFIREVLRLRAQPQKPSGIDRWVFWGLVKATHDLLEDGACECKDGENYSAYIPNVTKTLQRRLKEGKEAVACFGGLDVGTVVKEEA